MQVWTTTVAFFPNHYDLDGADYLDTVGDAIQGVNQSEQGAIEHAKRVITEAHSQGKTDDGVVTLVWHERRENDTVFLQSEPNPDALADECCFARVIPFEVAP